MIPPDDPPRARVFLLSHMRAYTSVLGHVLGSHPEIDGYCELHRSYVSTDDLARQRAQIAASDGLKPAARWLFDKLLHNDYTLDPDLPELAHAVVLTALRPPGPTLASILELFAQKPGDDPYASPEGAVHYYTGRLAALADFAERHPGRTRYFDATLVRTDPERLLATLTRWLGLASPLSPRYRRFSLTGVSGAGDTSSRLASGQILTVPEPAAAPSSCTPVQDTAAVLSAYHAARARLIRASCAQLLAA